MALGEFVVQSVIEFLGLIDFGLGLLGTVHRGFTSCTVPIGAKPLDPDRWSRLLQTTLTMRVSQDELQKVQCLVSHGNQELDHVALEGYTAIHHDDPSHAFKIKKS